MEFGDHFFEFDGFAEIVVHAGFEAFLFVAFHGVGGQGDDTGPGGGVGPGGWAGPASGPGGGVRLGAGLADKAGGFEPIHPGHLEVHQNDVKSFVGCGVDCLQAVVDHGWGITQFLEYIEDHLLVDHIVFGDEDLHG